MHLGSSYLDRHILHTILYYRPFFVDVYTNILNYFMESNMVHPVYTTILLRPVVPCSNGRCYKQGRLYFGGIVLQMPVPIKFI